MIAEQSISDNSTAVISALEKNPTDFHCVEELENLAGISKAARVAAIRELEEVGIIRCSPDGMLARLNDPSQDFQRVLMDEMGYQQIIDIKKILDFKFKRGMQDLLPHISNIQTAINSSTFIRNKERNEIYSIQSRLDTLELPPFYVSDQPDESELQHAVEILQRATYKKMLAAIDTPTIYTMENVESPTATFMMTTTRQPANRKRAFIGYFCLGNPDAADKRFLTRKEIPLVTPPNGIQHAPILVKTKQIHRVYKPVRIWVGHDPMAGGDLLVNMRQDVNFFMGCDDPIYEL